MLIHGKLSLPSRNRALERASTTRGAADQAEADQQLAGGRRRRRGASAVEDAGDGIGVGDDLEDLSLTCRPRDRVRTARSGVGLGVELVGEVGVIPVWHAVCGR